MAPVDRRVRLWSWVVRHQGSIASKSESDVIAIQERHIPDSALIKYILGTVPRGVQVTNRTIPGPAGNDIPVRTYQSESAGAGARPLVVYFHGGGFVVGDLRMGDWMCGSVAANAGAVVVSVEYRLAPRHPFPAAVDDCYVALQWAAEHAAELGAAGPLAVFGESAGGNLSAVMCLLARDRGGPEISHQTLLYPATDLTRVPSAEAANSLIINEAEMRAYRRHYLGDTDPADPRISPLLAGNHANLPPALIQVAEHDPLREDGIRYAAALRAAGVPVRLTEYPGVPHGYLNFPGVCRGAAKAMAEICEVQASALTGPADSTAVAQ
jgi:acetyl esterase